jgi:hypothetical protein
MRVGGVGLTITRVVEVVLVVVDSTQSTIALRVIRKMMIVIILRLPFGLYPRCNQEEDRIENETSSSHPPQKKGHNTTRLLLVLIIENWSTTHSTMPKLPMYKIPTMIRHARQI